MMALFPAESTKVKSLKPMPFKETLILMGSFASLSAFGATDPDHWAVGNVHGVVTDSDGLTGALPPLGLGDVFSVAGSSTGRAAAATAGGSILLFDNAVHSHHSLA